MRITPSAKTDPGLAFVATSHPPFMATQPEAARASGHALTLLLPAVGAIRNLGPTSWQIADVASGRIDAFWQYGRDANNLLPASLVAREAGALVTDCTGAPWHPGSDSFLAAAPTLHQRIIDIIGRPEPGEAVGVRDSVE